MKPTTLIIDILLIFSGIGIVLYAIVGSGSYLDLTHFCVIKLNEDMLHGNKNTIKKALAEISKSDKSSYTVICSNVRTISEKHCFNAAPEIDQAQFNKSWNEPGCYIRGSKIIYLLPEKDDTPAIIQKRAQEIKKLSFYSQLFWNPSEY